MSNRALILIDIQEDYFADGKWTLAGIDTAADNAAQLLDAARLSGDLVVHVRHEFPSDDAPFFTPGSDGARIHNKVQPLDGEIVILKHQVNAFKETDLKGVLDREGVKDIAICGAMSHMCIDAVTRAASDFGYVITLIHDACATCDLEFNGRTIPAADVHAAYMSALGFAYATLTSTDTFIAKK